MQLTFLEAKSNADKLGLTQKCEEGKQLKTAVKNSHGLPLWCQCRGHRFNPWSGKIPYTQGQLSPCVMTTEARIP